MTTLKCNHDLTAWRMKCMVCGHVSDTNQPWHGHNGLRAEFGFCSGCHPHMEKTKLIVGK